MPRSVTQQLAGWGNYPVRECHVYRPERVAEVRAVLREADRPDFISRGLGRGYGDAALSSTGGVILHTRLNRFLEFDPETGTLVAEAGVSIAEILQTFLSRGWVMPVTPGTKFVTLGGAVAADVHGKNHHCEGSIGEFIDWIDLMAANGDILRCSRNENPGVFWATMGGMGLTGAIIAVQLRLKHVESAYVTVDYGKANDLDAAIEAFAAGDGGYQYSVAWIDCLARGGKLGRSVLMRGNSTPLADLPADLKSEPCKAQNAKSKNVPAFLPGFVLNPLSVKTFNTLYYAKHRDTTRIVGLDNFFYPLDAVKNWNRIYGKRGFVQYQAVFPTESARPGLVTLLEKLTGAGRVSFLAVLKSFGDEGRGMLSFPKAGQTIALDLPNTGASTFALAAELDRIVLDHGGRIYLAKDACLDRASFEKMYPRLDEFKQVKARLDPTNQFASVQSVRLGITPARDGGRA